MMKRLMVVALALVAMAQLGNGLFVDGSDSSRRLIYYSQAGENDVANERDLTRRFATGRKDRDVVFMWTRRDWMKHDISRLLELKNGADVVGYYAGGEISQALIERDLVEDLHGLFVEEGLYDRIGPNLLAGVSGGEEGHPYMLPTDSYHWGVYYNRELLVDELNITMPIESYGDFLAACEKLKERGIQPITIGAKYQWPLAGWFDYLNMRINGPENHIKLLRGEANYTTDSIRKTFHAWQELIDKEYFPPFKQANEDTWWVMVDDLLQKKAGFALMGSFIRTVMTPEDAAKIDFFRFPVINRDLAIGEVAPTDGVLIPKSSIDKEGAKELVRYFASVEYQKERLAYASIPSNVDALEFITDPQILRGYEMLRSADQLTQFFDRDTKPEMAQIGMNAMTSFYKDPSNLDSILQGLESSRLEIYVNMAATPTANVASGTFTRPITVALQTRTTNATIHYTTDGSFPTEQSPVYKTPLRLTFHERYTLRAVATRKDLRNSKVLDLEYNILLFETTEDEVDWYVLVTGRVIASVGILYQIVFFATVCKYRKEPVFRASSPLFVHCMLCGLVIAQMSIFFLATSSCMAIFWCLGVGWGLCFGSIALKAYRALQLFNSGFKVVKITDRHLLGGVSLITVLEVVVLVAWTVVEPLTYSKTIINRETYAMTCNSPHSYWIYVFTLPNVIMLIVVIVICISTRKLASAFNESKSVGFAVYNLAIVGGISVATSVFMPTMNSIYLVRVIGIFLTCAIISSSIIIPKLYVLKFRPDLNQTTAWFKQSPGTKYTATSSKPPSFNTNNRCDSTNNLSKYSANNEKNMYAARRNCGPVDLDDRELMPLQKAREIVSQCTCFEKGREHEQDGEYWLDSDVLWLALLSLEDGQEFVEHACRWEWKFHPRGKENKAMVERYGFDVLPFLDDRITKGKPEEPWCVLPCLHALMTDSSLTEEQYCKCLNVFLKLPKAASLPTVTELPLRQWKVLLHDAKEGKDNHVKTILAKLTKFDPHGMAILEQVATGKQTDRGLPITLGQLNARFQQYECPSYDSYNIFNGGVVATGLSFGTKGDLLLFQSISTFYSDDTISRHSYMYSTLDGSQFVHAFNDSIFNKSFGLRSMIEGDRFECPGFSVPCAKIAPELMKNASDLIEKNVDKLERGLKACIQMAHLAEYHDSVFLTPDAIAGKVALEDDFQVIFDRIHIYKLPYSGQSLSQSPDLQKIVRALQDRTSLTEAELNGDTHPLHFLDDNHILSNMY